MIETDPVDALPLARCVAVAELDSPGRRMLLADEFERTLHRVLLVGDAFAFPAADEADVEEHRIVERRGRVRLSGRRHHPEPGKYRSGENSPLHARETDQSANRGQESDVLTASSRIRVMRPGHYSLIGARAHQGLRRTAQITAERALSRVARASRRGGSRTSMTGDSEARR